METARSLRYVITRTVGPASSARRQLSPRTVRTQATRGILVPSLVLAALGTVAAASPGHVGSSHVRSDVVLTRSCKVGSRPWIYRPWTYATPAIRTGPFIYGSSAVSGLRMNPTTIKTARTYAVPAIRTGPWIYGTAAITGPQMNTTTIKTARMYPAIIRRPWIYRAPDSLRALSACLADGAPA